MSHSLRLPRVIWIAVYVILALVSLNVALAQPAAPGATLHMPYARALLVDGARNLWAGSTNGAARRDATGWHTLTAGNGLSSNAVQVIAERRPTAEAAAETWFGHLGSGISILDANGSRFLTTADGLLSDNVRALAFAGTGVWVGHGAFGTHGQGGGLSYFDGATWQRWGRIPGIAGPSVVDLVVDARGRLWAAVSDYGTATAWLPGGLGMYDGVRWTVYDAANSPLRGSLQTVTADAMGAIWVGSDAGVWRFDGAVWTGFGLADGLPSADVRDLAVAPCGHIWAATANGVAQFDGATWHSHAAPAAFASAELTAVAVVADAEIWVGGVDGVSLLQFAADSVVEPAVVTYQIHLPIVLR